MQPVAVVFCYLNLFSLTKVSFDYNSWKNQFKKELLEAISSNKLKSEVIIEINDTSLIEVSLEKSIFNTFDDNNRLAIEIKLYRKSELKKLFPDIYSKDKSEFEIMDEAGYNRIWDCGNLVYEKVYK